MKPDELSQALFSLDPSLRYVGILDETKNLAVSKMRSGIKSVTSEDEDRYFMNVIPVAVLGALQRLAKYAGELTVMAAQYADVSLLMFYVDKYAVVVSTETKTLDTVLAKLREWKKSQH